MTKVAVYHDPKWQLVVPLNEGRRERGHTIVELCPPIKAPKSFSVQ